MIGDRAGGIRILYEYAERRVVDVLGIIGEDDRDAQTCGSRAPTAMVADDMRETTKRLRSPAALRLHSIIASAAAVASSNNEAFATAMPVSSVTIVWK